MSKRYKSFVRRVRGGKRCKIANVVLRQRLARALELAQTDELTGLLNLRGFREQATRMLARVMRAKYDNRHESVSLMFIDVDNFKLINDLYGHTGGDTALCAVAKALATKMRQEDLLARDGGDEFVAMLRGGKVAIERLVERVGRCISVTLSGGDHTVDVHLSVGCAVFNGRTTNVFNRGFEESSLTSCWLTYEVSLESKPTPQDIDRALLLMKTIASDAMKLAKARRGAGR